MRDWAGGHFILLGVVRATERHQIQHAETDITALVWCTQGMYDRYEYLEQIFLDATLHENAEQDSLPDKDLEKYDTINGYDARDYEQKPAEY